MATQSSTAVMVLFGKTYLKLLCVLNVVCQWIEANVPSFEKVEVA